MTSGTELRLYLGIFTRANPKGALSCFSVAAPALGQSWGWFWPSNGTLSPAPGAAWGQRPWGQRPWGSTGSCLMGTATQTRQTWCRISHHPWALPRALPKCLLLLTEGLLLKIWVQNRLRDSILASEMQAQTLREDINLPENCLRTHLWQHMQFSNYLLLTLPFFSQFIICALGLQGRTPGVMKALH